MISLIFKLFCWYYVCQPEMVLFFIKVILLLIILLIVIITINVVQNRLWRKKIDYIVDNHQECFKKSLALIDAGKISVLLINNVKNYLTSLRLIADSFKDKNLLNDKKQFNKYLSTADSLLHNIKKREMLLHRQLNPRTDVRLFDLVEEIESLLMIYDGILRENKIKLHFHSDREYRIFANEDILLLVINTILLKSIEALILSNKKSKYLKISLIKSSYLLKIIIENNADIKDFQKIIPNNLFNCPNDQKQLIKLTGFNFVDQIMCQYFYKKIAISTPKNQNMTICLKIKKSFILAEPKKLKKIRM